MSKWSNILTDPDLKLAYDAGREAAIDRILEIIDGRIAQIGNERESISKSARLSDERCLRKIIEGLKEGDNGI